MDDKRKEKRVLDERKLNLQVISPGGDEPAFEGSMSALTMDISMGGLRFISDVDLPIDTRLKIAFSTKTRKVINISGQVRWRRVIFDGEAFEIGVEFVETAPDKIVLLLEHLYGKDTNPA